MSIRYSEEQPAAAMATQLFLRGISRGTVLAQHTSCPGNSMSYDCSPSLRHSPRVFCSLWLSLHPSDTCSNPRPRNTQMLKEHLLAYTPLNSHAKEEPEISIYEALWPQRLNKPTYEQCNDSEWPAHTQGSRAPNASLIICIKSQTIHALPVI